MKGNLTRRGKRSWRLKFDAGRDADGTRQTKFVTLKGTRAEASAQAAQIVAAATTGGHVDASRETVREFATRWLRDWAAPNVSAKTAERYAELLNTACAQIGGVPMQKLTAADLARLYSGLTRLAPRTRLHVHRVLHRMLTHATQWNVTGTNVAAKVDAPRAAAAQVEVLPAAIMQQALEALRGRTLFPIAALALGSGARRGELLALRWCDLDLTGGKLRVERSLEQTKAGLRFKAPKTKHGRRTITLAPTTIEILQDHRRRQLEQRLALGHGKQAADDLVFPNADGDVRSPRSITKDWSMTMQRLGIRATFHALRHTHASELIRGGVDVLSISRRLGHGSPSITLNVYGHLIRPDDRAAQIIEAALSE